MQLLRVDGPIRHNSKNRKTKTGANFDRTSLGCPIERIPLTENDPLLSTDLLNLKSETFLITGSEKEIKMLSGGCRRRKVQDVSV